MVPRVVNVDLPVHGGDVASVVARYGPGEWLDFSANIAPNGPPAAVLDVLRRADDIAALAQYPTAHDRALRGALARALGVAEPSIVLANGAAALIEAFVRTVAPRRALLLEPAFSEYERALAAQRSDVVALPLDPDDGFRLDAGAVIAALDRASPDALILTNPHNPSGACTSRASIDGLVEAAAARGIACLLDEAFVDYVPECSAIHDVRRDNVLVVRSLTKVYAMPGLRVGYGVALPSFARALTARIPTWPITSLAADAAAAAVGDAAYADRTRAANAAERAALAASLRELGLHVFEGAANFLLWRSTLPAPAVAERLAADHRIIVRDCSSFRGLETGGYVRVAVRTRSENDRLVAALRTVLAGV